MSAISVAPASADGHGPPVMLTGNQIRTARTWAGIESQGELAERVGVHRATIQRAEKAGDEIYGAMTVANMLAIIGVFEQAGAEFTIKPGESIARGAEMHLPQRAKALPPLMGIVVQPGEDRP